MITSKTAACTFCRTKTSPTMRPSSASSAVTENLHKLPPVVILRLRNMTALDATGLFAIEEVAKQLHASKRTLILCGAREQPAQLIHQAEFAEVIGEENICDNVLDALRRAEEVYEGLEQKFVVARS